MSTKTYRFKAELDDYEPKITRTFTITGDETMQNFIYALESIFNMTNSHMWDLRQLGFKAKAVKPDPTFQLMDEKRFEELLNETHNYERIFILNKDSEFADDFHGDINFTARDHTIDSLNFVEGTEFEFYYDYGDDWSVSLYLEKITYGDSEVESDIEVLECQGYGIIDDVGGTPGLEDFAKAMKSGRGNAYKEFKSWYGQRVQIDVCDKRELNRRIYSDIKLFTNGDKGAFEE